ncbi:hypothetical protein V6N11_048338 [Hibiscus sabdariffa]|uniref:Gnk2-homologous domain-containing protein n=1 Tax=Hibiscus sabdariffa TaxID=183260 RepID=A0ABR2PV26_9ROSI
MDILTALINLLLCLVAVVLSLLNPAAEAQQPTYPLPHRGDGFYNTTSGRGADMVYGLFLCRGNFSTSVCQACVTFAAGDISRRCPVEITAVIWYDECLLRYSNQSIFSIVAEAPRVGLVNTQNITDQDRFNRQLQAVMDDTVTEAANASPGAKKFAIREANFSSFQNLYTLAQCTPDLSSLDCDRCLQILMANLPIGRQGGRVLTPSCNVRYEIYRFYNQTAVAPPPPPPPPPAPASGGNGRRTWPIIIAIVAPITVCILFLFLACWLLKRRASKKDDHVQTENGYEITTVDSLQYDFTTIETATDNFSEANKLGEGGEEKILIYEYVPNKSLDYFVFDPAKQEQLDWSSRYKIIGGIARGTTRRVVGTYGYMSPEYAMHGQFSVKSDVYSFGVLVLEIISGQKNSNFYETDGAQDLISYAWKLWKDNRPLDLLNPVLRDNYSRNEVIRCIQLGLLCVQEDPAERPTMATVVLTLNSYSVTLSMPKEPAFVFHSRSEGMMPYKGLESDKSTSQSAPWSINDVSITELDPRTDGANLDSLLALLSSNDTRGVGFYNTAAGRNPNMLVYEIFMV